MLYKERLGNSTCKINLFLGIKDSLLSVKVAKYIEKRISMSQPHGFGYMCSDGRTISHERWLHNDMAWYHINKSTPWYDRSKERVLGTMTSYCGHGRYATSAKNIQNTHPFYSSDTYLIHNGVVSEHGLRYETSTCDSEGILNAYVDLGVEYDVTKAQNLYDKLSGWFACAVMTPRYVDVFKNEGASLYWTKTNQLGYVYCTCETILSEALKKFNIEHEGISMLVSNVLIRHDIVTGEVLITQKVAHSYKRYNYSGYTNYNSYKDHWNKDVTKSGNKTSYVDKQQYMDWEDYWDSRDEKAINEYCVRQIKDRKKGE